MRIDGAAVVTMAGIIGFVAIIITAIIVINGKPEADSIEEGPGAAEVHIEAHLPLFTLMVEHTSQPPVQQCYFGGFPKANTFIIPLSPVDSPPPEMPIAYLCWSEGGFRTVLPEGAQVLNPQREVQIDWLGPRPLH